MMAQLLLWVRLMRLGQVLGFETLTPYELEQLDRWEKEALKYGKPNKEQEPVGSDSEHSDRDSA